MKKNLKINPFFLLWPLILSGCVATREDVAGIETQMERLEKRQAELSSQLDAMKTPVMSLNSNLMDTQNLLTNFTARFEELRAHLENLKKDLSQRTAELSERLTELNAQLSEMGGDLQAKLAEIRKGQGASSSKKSAPAKSESVKKNDSGKTGNGAPPSDSSTPLAVFQASYKDYLAGRWQLAEEGFNQYLKKEPEGSLADKSLYYLALSAKARGERQIASEKFDQIADRFPKSPVARSAMLEKARMKMEDKKIGEAEGLLEYIAITYPKSQEAADARELLKKLPHPNP